MKTDPTAKYNIKNELLDRDNNQTRYIIQTIKIIARNKKKWHHKLYGKKNPVRKLLFIQPGLKMVL